MKKEIIYLLGVDGGGSKTEMALANNTGVILFRTLLPATNTHTSDDRKIISLLQEGYDTLIRHASIRKNPPDSLYAVFGIAGLDNPKEYRQFNRIVHTAFSHIPCKSTVVNDTIIGRWSGSHRSWGIGAIIGTGTNCYGINQKGEERWSSGMGHKLADEGSAFYIGDRVLRTAVQSADGRGPHTILEKMVLNHFSVKTIREVSSIVYTTSFGKKETAEIGILADRACIKGDRVAKMIMQDACFELMRMFSAVIIPLGLHSTDVEVVLAGGLIQNSKPLWILIQQAFQEQFPKALLVRPRQKPVIGAIRLAKHLLSQSS